MDTRRTSKKPIRWKAYRFLVFSVVVVLLGMGIKRLMALIRKTTRI